MEKDDKITKIYFKHPGALVIEGIDGKTNKKKINYVTIPPVKNCIDVINLGNKKFDGFTDYYHNLDGLVVVTSDWVRNVYFNGEYMCGICVRKIFDNELK